MNPIIFNALFGAFVVEFIHWWELRKDHNHPNFPLLKSPIYWALTLGMMVLSAYGTYLMFEAQLEDKVALQVITGAAFPLLVKKLVKNLLQDNGSTLYKGFQPSGSFRIKDYFV